MHVTVALEQPREECPLNMRGGLKDLGRNRFVPGLRVGPEIEQSFQGYAQRSREDDVVFGLRLIPLAKDLDSEKRTGQLCEIIVERWVGVDEPDVSALRGITLGNDQAKKASEIWCEHGG